MVITERLSNKRLNTERLANIHSFFDSLPSDIIFNSSISDGTIPIDIATYSIPVNTLSTSVPFNTLSTSIPVNTLSSRTISVDPMTTIVATGTTPNNIVFYLSDSKVRAVLAAPFLLQ